MKKKGVVGFIFCLILFLSIFLVQASQLRVTEEHPFLVNGEWISASQLEVGDLLQTPDGREVVIKNITDVVLEDNFLDYNLEANEYSNFIVSSDGVGVVVHNSNLLVKPSDKGELTFQKFVRLLTKPGGDNKAAELQALDAMDLIHNKKQPYKEDFRIAVESHLEAVQRYAPNPQQEAFFIKVLGKLEAGSDGIAVSGGETTFGVVSRWTNEYNLAKKNFFSGMFSDNTKIISATYKLYVKGIYYKDVEVIYAFEHDPLGKTITFKTAGGVRDTLNEKSYSLRDTLLLLDNLKTEAITAPTTAQRARAIAEFEWVHAATSPSVYGGGTVLAIVDYPLLESAGFKILDTSFRRVETEAITMPREKWLDQRTKELISLRNIP